MGNTLNIRELKDGMRRVSVEGTVTDKSEARSVNLRTGGQARVADATIQDETGSVKLSLWDEMIDQVNVGDKVQIENGYTNSFRGEVRVNVGRYGKFNVVQA
ncbi:MAG: DNA-binding protein [Thaumarchaeota archaeon]|nr:DNA-binding protein [Nitrososphaerota archaeon]